MLLSNEIEKALYNGECVYKTFNTGYTNTFTIPMPKGSYIILRQIIYYPVISSAADFLTRSVVQLSINEQGSNNEMLYSFRNNINAINTSINPAIPNLIFTGGNPQNVETWKVFKKNITIDLCFGDSSTNLVYAANNIFEESADERPTPLGYNSLSIQNQVAIQPGLNRIYPTGQQRQFIPPNEFQGPVRDRLRYDNNLNNLIPNADILQNSVAYQFPLFTFGYFEFQTAKSINLQ